MSEQAQHQQQLDIGLMAPPSTPSASALTCLVQSQHQQQQEQALRRLGVREGPVALPGQAACPALQDSVHILGLHPPAVAVQNQVAQIWVLQQRLHGPPHAICVG